MSRTHRDWKPAPDICTVCGSPKASHCPAALSIVLRALEIRSRSHKQNIYLAGQVERLTDEVRRLNRALRERAAATKESA